MTPAERIQRVILEFQLNNAEELARNINTDGDLIRNILTGRTKKMSGKVAKAIINKYPVSYLWLMIGEGDIFDTTNKVREKGKSYTKLSLPDCAVCEEKERLIKLLEERVEEQSRTIKIHEKCIEELSRREPAEKYRGSG